MVFSKKNLTNNPNLKFFNTPLSFKPCVKFLGMWFDKKLTWKEHIRQLVLTCNKKLNLMRTLSNKYWGSDRSTLLTIYRMLIRSKLDYGSIAYASASPTLLKQLDSVHNTALRLSLGAFRTSPVESLYSESGEPFLYHRRTYLTLSHATSIASNVNKHVFNNTFTNKYINLFTNSTKHKPYYERVRCYLRCLDVEFPDILPINIKNPSPWLINIPNINTALTQFDKHINSHAEIQHHLDLVLKENYEYCYKIFTDASKCERGVGAAFVTPSNTYQFRLPSYFSIFSAELYAVLKAIMHINSNDISNSVILSDSLSALQTLKQIYPKGPIEKHIKFELMQAQENARRIRFIWIPSHIGIAGNEKADQCASEIAVCADIEKDECRNTASDIKAYFKNRVLCKWKNEWQSSQTSLRLIKNDIIAWEPSTRNRREQLVITRLRIGHTRLTHSYLLSKSDPPVCEICNVQITVNHLLIVCPRFANYRVMFNIPKCISNLLGTNCSTDNITKFLKSTGIFYKI